MVVARALILSVLASSCVSTHQGLPVDYGQMKISCNFSDELETDQFRLMTFTLENVSGDWVDFAGKGASFTKESGSEVLSPNSAQELITAYNQKKAQSDFNKEMISLGLAVGGMVVGIVARANSNVETAGHAAVAAGVTAGAVNKMDKEVAKAKGEDLTYGADHLLGPATRIPPGLFVRKHLLVAGKNWDKPGQLEVCLEKPAGDCFDITVQHNVKRRSNVCVVRRAGAPAWSGF